MNRFQPSLCDGTNHTEAFPGLKGRAKFNRHFATKDRLFPLPLQCGDLTPLSFRSQLQSADKSAHSKTVSPAKAGFVFVGGRDPRVTLAALAHWGYQYAAPTALVELLRDRER